MRVAVMGAGSIGGYFGGMLSRHGNQVTLIARGAHLDSINRNGLKIVTDEGEFVVRCDATDDPGAVGEVDLALLTVKTYHNPQAVPAMLPLIGENTVVLCLQNGIDSYREAAKILGVDRVWPAAAYIEATLVAPGVVRQAGDAGRIVFGEPDGSDSARGRQLLDTLELSGIPAEFTRDIQRTLWTKFLFIATLAGVTSISRETMDQLIPRPEWLHVITECMKEIESVGRASGVNLDLSVVEDTLAYIKGSLDQMQASMHTDIMAGRPLELESLNGAVVRAGRDAGVPTPINDVFYALLKPYLTG